MTEWEPATDAEIAMRNALRTDDQESYFRILAGVDLLLPVSADALAGLAPLGWGTWSTGGRTHVLAFTSPSALQACLADYTGSARRVAYAELADTWPNLEWWLAVNPGLPVEGYLPAWFVAQLSRGDLRLPTRGPGREGSNAPNRIQDLHAAATLAATAAAQGYNAPAQNYAAPASGGPMQGSPMPGSPATSGAPSGGVAPSGATAGGPGSGGPAYGGGAAAGTGARGYGGRGPGGSDSSGAAGDSPYRRPGSGGAASGGASSDRPASGGVGSGGPAYGGAGQSGSGAQAFAGSGGPANAGVSPGGSTPAAGTTSAASPYAAGAATEGRPAAGPGAAPSSSASPADAGQVGPGGLPLRTPGAVLPSGLPSRVPGAPAGADGGIPGGQFNGFGTRPVSQPGEQSSQPQGPASAQPSALQEQAGGPRPTAGDVPAAYRPPTLPAREAAAPGTPARSASGPSALSALGSRSPGSVSERATPPSSPPPASPPPALQRLDAPLPTRTPMAQTPPLPAHIPPPSEQEADGAEPDGDAVRDLPDESQTASGGLPRRQMPPAEKPPSAMAAAAQALAGTRSPGAPQTPVTTRQPGLAPPVIPGAAGAGRGTTPPIVPAAAARPTIPPTRPEPAEQRPAVRPDPQPAAPAADVEDDFIPANEVERDLLHAVDEGSTDAFLSTLLLATVHVPVADNSRPGSAPGESGFAFRTEEFDGEVFLVVFTSRDRLGEHFAEPTRTVGVRFVDLIRNWPDPAWSFAVNPTSPIGARYPGPQVIALAAWAVEAGLGGEPVDAPVEQPQRPAEPTAQLTIMQKAVPAEQIDYYLERGYDRIAGFVHRAGEVEHLRSPGDLFAALGLLYDGSPYQGDAKEAFVLRWPAHRPSLYRIPYGGQSEQALRAMDGWVIERPPFRGNGFAPGEGKDVIAEFKVDSVRLPHGAQLWRMDADGDDQMIAVFDCDAPVWRRVGEQ